MPADGNQFIDQMLLRRAWTGDESAKEELVRKYLPMVRRIVRGQTVYWPDYEDLSQEGVIGLLKAIGEYDPGRFAIKFSTFAYICILRRVTNAIKQAMTKKTRALTEAVSLSSNVTRDDCRTLMDCLVAEDVDPFDLVVQRWSEERLDAVLRAHLSGVEYAVIALFLRGRTAGEIQAALALEPKIVDNARTRARAKLRRLVVRYGSLLNPELPLSAKKRLDLAMCVRVG